MTNTSTDRRPWRLRRPGEEGRMSEEDSVLGTTEFVQDVPGATMTAFTIEEFWTQRLSTSHAEPIAQTKGWKLINDSVATFKEAPLDLSDEFTFEFSPLTSPLILVSAPGAVGKTTLAKQIAYRTGAIYIDLAQSEPVGGHTLSGGLVRAGVYERWQAEATTVLVDGLDEARLRVTQEAFEAFLGDVLELSAKRTLPTVFWALRVCSGHMVHLGDK